MLQRLIRNIKYLGAFHSMFIKNKEAENRRIFLKCCDFLDTSDVPSCDLWDIFLAYVERFKWEDPKEGSAKKTGSVKSKSQGKDILVTPGIKKGQVNIPKGIENQPEGERFVIICCDSSDLKEDTEGESFTGRQVMKFLSQVRDIPIVQPPPRPELEFWKTFRYEKWAVEQGIISPDLKKLNIQSLKIVDPFKRIIQEMKDLMDFPQSTNGADVDNADKKSEKSSKSSKKAATKTRTSQLEPDPSTWVDFKDIKDHIKSINIYYQPRTFVSKTRISDLNFKSKVDGFNHILYPTVLKETRNEPIYLFMDSIDFKFLMINIAQMGDTSVLQKKVKEKDQCEGRDSTESMDICEEIVLCKTRVKTRSDSAIELEYKARSFFEIKKQPVSVILEEYKWDSDEAGTPKGMISTLGTKSFIINLKPGRVSFKLWLSSHCPYVLQVFSDTPLTIGTLEQYLTACSAESQLLQNLCYELASCFGKLVQSFGMPDHSLSLRNFYNSYKPFQYLSKQELATIHRVFFMEFCKIIAENCTIPNAVDYVKLLFLQLKTFSYITPYIEEPHLYPDKFQIPDQVEYAKIMQRAAVQIQAFFKSIYIRSVMKKMNENHPEYYGIFDSLKRIYIEIFSSDKRLTYCPTLIRRCFENYEMDLLKNKFELYHDIQSVLNLITYNGTIMVNAFSWVPICRYEFHCNIKQPIVIKMSLFCNLKNYFVRVFNNDTLEEISRVTNNVMVSTYTINKNGYSILCYGWSDDTLRVNWKLYFAYPKLSRGDLILIPNVVATNISFKEQYIPSADSTVCRYKINVGSDALLTANLTTSFDQARVCLKLLDSNGKLLKIASGVKCALFPVVDLRFCEASDSVLQAINAEAAAIQNQGGQKKRVTTVSESSEITYSKLKKHAKEDSRTSVRSGSFSKKKKSIGETQDTDDNISHTSQRSHESEGRSGRRSQNKLNPGRSSKSSVKGFLTKIVDYEKTSYILEAKVLGDSWPLTAEEWSRVKNVQVKRYLNLLEVKKSSSRRLSTPRKSSPVEEPYWTLDFVFVSEHPIEFDQDNSQMERRTEIKNKWFSDPERYKRGLELREKFLKEQSRSRENLSDNKSERSNDAKDFATKIIPGPTLEEFMIKPVEEVDEDLCKTKTNDDYIIDEANLEHALRKYEEDEKARQEEIEGIIQEQNENFALISQWFAEIRNDSHDLLSDAIAVGRNVVKEASAKLPAKNKGEKTKKEAKKKK